MLETRPRVALAAWLATMGSAAALLPLVRDSGWLVQAGLLLAAQTATGMVARRLGAPAALAVAAQVLVSLLLVTVSTVSAYALGGLLPGPEAFGRFGELLSAGAEDIGHYVAPAPMTDGIRLMLLAGVLLIGLLVDVLAVTSASAAAAGLPLLALYSIAAGVNQEQAGWLYFLAAAAGYLLLLLAEGQERLDRWGRYFTGPGPARGYGYGQPAAAAPPAQSAGPRLRAGRRIGALTLGAAVLAPVLMPTLGEGLLDLDGRGSGTGTGGSGPISSVNPVVALQDQLNQPQNQQVLTYRTEGGDPTGMYLRLVALDEFTGSEWKSSRWLENEVPAAPWLVPGLGPGVAFQEMTTEIEASGSYAQTSLPVPYPAVSVMTDGAWWFDRGSQTLVSDNGRMTTQGRTWTVTHRQVQPTAEQLAGAPPAPANLASYYTQVPPDLPEVVAELAREVTADAADDHARAVALQDWFAKDGGFRYNTDVSSGSGSEAIAAFLEDREGFCVHFAFSMAAMARTLGIPAQVAVGFTPGDRQVDGSYRVGLHNAHAWPELYFEGVGWTRFEPTPGQGNTPDYTLPEADRPDPAQPGEEDTETAEPEAPENSPAPTDPETCDPVREAAACESEAPAPAGGGSGGGPSPGPWLWGAGAALALLAVLAVPPLWRERVRSRRLAPGAGATAAWQELSDSAWDLGLGPLAAETPRQTATRITTVIPLDAAARDAVHRLATGVERELYAPAPPGAGAPGAEPADEGPARDVRTALAGLRAGVGRGTRWRALLLPRSAIRVTYRMSEQRLRAARRLRERRTAFLGKMRKA
ncbi:transglutaminase family protein [Streptomyces xiamenensis]|uniref:transglutaminase family protein n=1 Tax=Streptomyces xiamenensis TaxID=408015 RepID=UPI0035D7E87F